MKRVKIVDSSFQAVDQSGTVNVNAGTDTAIKTEPVVTAAAKAEPEPKAKPVKQDIPVPAVNAAEPDHTESRRTAAIIAFGQGKNPALEAQAISEGWDLSRFKAALADADVPTAQFSKPNESDVDNKVIECAGVRQGGAAETFVLKKYGEKTLEASDKFMGYGLQELLQAAAGGVELGSFRREPNQWLKAAFSTVSVPGILSNIANKSLLAAYEEAAPNWNQIVRIASVNDFKTHTRYRLSGDFKFEKLPPDGEIKHGSVAENNFTQKIDTYAKMFSLTRQMIINDDLSAFTEIPRMVGQGAADAINDAVWQLILSNPNNFFSAANKNLIVAPLTIDGLTDAEANLALQEARPGRPMGLSAKYLLVPTALKVTAETIMKSTEILVNSATKTPKVNPHAGKWEIVSTPFLQAPAFANSSPTTWYLFADPNRLAAFEVAFLNGKQAPTVETADADFNTLGVQFRGYFDFGVKEQDYRGALKCTAT